MSQTIVIAAKNMPLKQGSSGRPVFKLNSSKKKTLNISCNKEEELEIINKCMALGNDRLTWIGPKSSWEGQV